MADSLHTKGPWRCYADLPSTEPNWHIVTNESRKRVLANVHIEPGNAVDAANARLIAAAPELLEALAAIRRELDAMSGSWTEGMANFAQMADAALAKAGA